MHSHACLYLLPSCLLLLVYLDDVRCICFCVRLCLSHADVVDDLLVTSLRHISVLVYLCNKLVIVLDIAFVYCS